jgi:dipeptidyl aminopeptidase/acylaminoacyl peptidase
MIRFYRPLLLALAIALLATSGFAAEQRPLKIDDMFKFKRVAAPQISPDGKLVAYQLTTVKLDENKSTAAIWLAASDGKTPPKQLTDPNGKKDTAPRWSPDGKKILFESTRSGIPQLWLVAAEGGEPRQLTEISTGAATGMWSPDGTRIAFVSAVYPEFSEKPFAESNKLNKEKEDELEKSPVKAKVFTKLFFRHWDEYVGDKREHLFVIGADGKDCRYVTPGDRDAYHQRGRLHLHSRQQIPGLHGRAHPGRSLEHQPRSLSREHHQYLSQVGEFDRRQQGRGRWTEVLGQRQKIGLASTDQGRLRSR